MSCQVCQQARLQTSEAGHLSCCGLRIGVTPCICCTEVQSRRPQDPVFDLLLRAMFGEIEEFEKQMLEPSREILEHAKAVGQHIVQASVILCPAQSIPLKTFVQR